MAKTRCTVECCEDFKRVEAEKGALILAVARKRDFRWLIEAPGTRYLAVQRLHMSDNFEWTTDHDRALAFRSKEQADALMMTVRQMDRTYAAGALFAFEITLGNAAVVEHGWM